MEIEIQNKSFIITDKDYRIIINQENDNRWNYDFYKVPDDVFDDSSKMIPACAPFTAQGYPWKQNRYKDSLFVNCMMKVFNATKEDMQKLVNEIVTELYKRSDEYLEIYPQNSKEENIEKPRELSQEEKDHINSRCNEIFEINEANHKFLLESIMYCLEEYKGDEELKELGILSISSLGVKNILEPIHLHAWGVQESGKTYMFSKFKDMLAMCMKLLSDNVSPKVLYRAKLHPNMVISLNDKVIDENFGELLNCICDAKSWENGFVYTVTGQDNEPVDLYFPPRVIFHVSTNKPILEYMKKDMKVDLQAVQSKFFSFKKEYTENQKDEIKNKMLERINNDLQKDTKYLDIIQKIFEILIENPKNIHIPFSREQIENLMGKTGPRDFGQVCSLCQTYALISGYDEVTEDCIKHVAELLDKIPRESKLMVDNQDIVSSVMIPKQYFMLDEKNPIWQNCTVDGIANLSELSKDTIYPLLREMRKHGLVEYKAGARNKKYYYKIKDTTIPAWMKANSTEINKKPEPEVFCTICHRSQKEVQGIIEDGICVQCANERNDKYMENLNKENTKNSLFNMQD